MFRSWAERQRLAEGLAALAAMKAAMRPLLPWPLMAGTWTRAACAMSRLATRWAGAPAIW